MSVASTPGPEVADHDDVYRGITTPSWWVAEEGRPSSAAFRHPRFSVDVVSLAGSPEHTLSHLPVGSGLVSFNCGAARQIGFVTRLERDAMHPDNSAHANVYSSPSSSKRKVMAQKLVGLCTLVREPAFGV
jgi:hypothetical protein